MDFLGFLNLQTPYMYVIQLIKKNSSVVQIEDDFYFFFFALINNQICPRIIKNATRGPVIIAQLSLGGFSTALATRAAGKQPRRRRRACQPAPATPIVRKVGRENLINR